MLFTKLAIKMRAQAAVRNTAMLQYRNQANAKSNKTSNTLLHVINQVNPQND